MKITAAWTAEAVRALVITRNRYKRPRKYADYYGDETRCALCLLSIKYTGEDACCDACPYEIVYDNIDCGGENSPGIPGDGNNDISYPVRKARMDFIDETIALVKALPEDE